MSDPEKEDMKGSHFFPLLSKYNMNEVKIDDKGLKRYINLDIEHICLGGIYANKLFGKSKLPIIERLINDLMRTENYSGMKIKAYKVTKSAFEIIEKRMKINPMQVFIDALQNTAPMEETTRLRFGGISVPKAVDISPQRRLDIALRNICQGAVDVSHKNKKRMEACLAEEIIKASKNDVTSFAVVKKNDTERVAKAAR